ncbi:MAG: hypothetical protein HOP30_17775 [Cyclobacteriaceae bacterium]|nr:hypothetical protein [Cyclobacteriaceae bacterium]
MKQIFSIVFLTILVNVSFGQDTLSQNEDNISCQSLTDTLTNLVVFKVVDKMPTVAGGMPALYNDILKGIIFPSASKLKMGSKVFVAFVVDTNGQIIGKRVLRNITGTNIAEQILRIIGDMKWILGTCNEKAVSTLMMLPIIICVK